MTREELTNILEDAGETTYLLDGDEWDNALIGFTERPIRAVYDVNLAAIAMEERDGVTEEDALDFISFNTVRTIEYMELQEQRTGIAAPVLVYGITH